MSDFRTADLEWRDERTPVSKDFDDVYFSIEDGLAESRYVFLEGNGLSGGKPRWRESAHFTIAETGFGTGLNFLATWMAWRESAEAHQRLTFLSVEGFPLDRDQLTQALSVWEELGDLRDSLIAAYPALQPGFHRLVFDEGRVELLLLLGEVQDCLSLVEGRVDAWYLDGFAPSKNPDMWCEGVYRQLARLSHPGTTLATFTAAGHVRRGLEEAGFEMSKVKGFKNKRERLVGTFREADKAEKQKNPWFELPAKKRDVKSVAVIGGGIAGNTLAYTLRQAGMEVTLFERRQALAQGASGNPAAMFEPKLLHESSTLGRLLCASYLYALRFYDQLEESSGRPVWKARCGALHLIGDEKTLTRQKELMEAPSLPAGYAELVEVAQASKLAGVKVDKPGLWYPKAGCLDTRALAESLTSGIELRTGVQVEDLRQDEEGRWRLLDGEGAELLTCDAVVLANAFEAARLAQAEALPQRMNRGQVSLLPKQEESENLTCIVSGKGYLSPLIGDQHVFGATFERLAEPEEAADEAVTTEGHRHNLDLLRENLPDFAEGVEMETLKGRTSVRATTPDHLPIVGPLHQQRAYLTNYAALSDGARNWTWPSASYHDGLYVSVGFGSRGFVTAPLMAASLAAMIKGTPLPLPDDLREAVHPARFVIRDLKRSRLEA